MFGINYLIDVLVPDIPKSLLLKIKREQYLAKQALQEKDHEYVSRDINHFVLKVLTLSPT